MGVCGYVLVRVWVLWAARSEFTRLARHQRVVGQRRAWVLAWAGSGLYDQLVLALFDRCWRGALVYAVLPLGEARVGERAATLGCALLSLGGGLAGLRPQAGLGVLFMLAGLLLLGLLCFGFLTWGL